MLLREKGFRKNSFYFCFPKNVISNTKEPFLLHIPLGAEKEPEDCFYTMERVQVQVRSSPSPVINCRTSPRTPILSHCTGNTIRYEEETLQYSGV